MLVSSLFEKLDPDLVFSGLEDGLAGSGNGTVVAVVIDDQGVVEEEFGTVVGVEVERMYSFWARPGVDPTKQSGVKTINGRRLLMARNAILVFNAPKVGHAL